MDGTKEVGKRMVVVEVSVNGRGLVRVSRICSSQLIVEMIPNCYAAAGFSFVETRLTELSC